MYGRKMLKTVSPHALPGVMENAVCRYLQQKGYKFCEENIRPEDLFSADGILLTNSLMGAVPALSLNGKKLPAPSDIWREINQEVL